jgi:hypothetical protein
MRFFPAARKFVVLCTPLLVFISAATGQTLHARAEMKLKGPVRSILEKVYAATDTFFHPENRLISGMMYKFDSVGYLIGTVAYNEKEKATGYTNFTYDSVTGRKMIEREFFPDSALKEKTTFKYDAAGNEIEERVYERNDTLKPALVNHFDPKAKEEPEFDSDEEKIDIVITTRPRRPDAMGNWTRLFTFEKKVAVSVTTREIEYFRKPEE